MSFDHIYEQACCHINRAVAIHCHDGVVHHGFVESVDREHVYIRQIDDGAGGGPGVFVWGAFAGGFAGALTGVALGNILFFRPYPYYY